MHYSGGWVQRRPLALQFKRSFIFVFSCWTWIIFPNSKGDLTGQTEEETLYLSMDPEQTWIFPIQIMISQIVPAGWRLSMIHICLQRLRTSTTSSPWPHLSSFILKPKDCVSLSKYINTLKQPVRHFILYHLHLMWGKQLEWFRQSQDHQGVFPKCIFERKFWEVY